MIGAQYSERRDVEGQLFEDGENPTEGHPTGGARLLERIQCSCIFPKIEGRSYLESFSSTQETFGSLAVADWM